MSHLPDNQRVVVTGLGALTPIGLDTESFFSGLLSGRNGISRVEAFDTEKFNCKIGGEIKDFDATQWMDPKEVRRNDRFVQLAFAAAKQAVAHAGLDMAKEDPERVGIFVGSGIGGMDTMEKNCAKLIAEGPRKVSPFMIPALISNMASGIIAIEMGAMGPNFSIVSACATGAHAIGESLKTLRCGEADVMVAGGAESCVNRIALAGFAACRALSTGFNDAPGQASRPYDKDRDGFVMGEGAGIVVLEDYERAKARGLLHPGRALSDEEALQLILEPEYLDDREYSLRGDFVLGDADALELSATVHGGCASRYQPENVEIGPQMTAPMGEVMNGKVHSNGVLVWEIHQHIIGARLDPARLHGRMRNIDLNESFNFVVTRSEP